jgi:2-oxoglutarate ferredoxin oxidoreductase subunit alpha
MVDADLEDGAATLVLGYGITGGAVRAAVATARSRGERVSGLVLQTLWPVPEIAIGAALSGVKRVIVPELNPGLYRREIERIAGGRTVIGVERIDGELISPEQILAAAA